MAECSTSIDDLAGAILDGASIDWTSAESSADIGTHALLRELRLVAAVAAAHRRRPQLTESGPTLFIQPPWSTPPRPAMVDGKYRIERSLGHGGMGFVYCARHIELDKCFALKLLQPHRSFRPDSIARFQIEAHALGRLNHPNIVQVTDFGVDGAVGPYLVMEYIEGKTLSAELTERGPLPLDEALPIFTGISRGLDYAHASGILHRDLKPGNVVLFTRSDGHRDAKIVDFGIASFLDTPDAGAPNRSPVEPGSQTTASSAIVGTLEYIAPEILDGGRASAAADVFAFGVLIYETVVGRRPFGRSDRDPVDAQSSQVRSLPSDAQATIPPDLDKAILRPLHTDPACRPSRAQDVVSGLLGASDVAAMRLWRRTELPKRAALAALMSLLVIVLYGPLQKARIVQALESMFVDVRMALQPRRAPDPRIVLISIDDATLAADAQPLAEMADVAGARLQQVFGAGARTIAVDLLLPEQWSRSDAFVGLVLRNAQHMVLAGYSSADGKVSGPESVQGLVTAALGPSAIQKIFGFVNVSPDSDGVVRTIPLVYQDRRGAQAHSLVARAAESFAGTSLAAAAPDTRLWIDYSIDWRQFLRVSWKDIPDLLARQPEMFRDRVALVGAEFVGSGDVHNTSAYLPNQPRDISGLVLHALALNTLLGGTHIKTLEPPLVVLFLAVGAFIAVLTLLMTARTFQAVGVLSLIPIVYVLISLLLFRGSHLIVPVFQPIVMFSLATFAALVLRSRLSHHPLPRAPKEIAV